MREAGRQPLRQGSVEGQISGQGIELQGRVPIQLHQGLAQGLGGHLPDPQQLQPGGGQGQHLPLPVVVDHLLDGAAGIGLQAQIGGQSGRQGLALQAAPGEPVDGGDVGPVEFLQGQEQAAPQ